MYSDYKVYGPYTSKSDNRQRVILVHKETKKKLTVSYPKYLIEKYIGRFLSANEQVHHKDKDVTNNDLSNLEIVIIGEHQRMHNPPKYTSNIITRCVWCHKLMILTPKQQQTRTCNAQRHKAGPFCSRSCSGKYGRSIQMGTFEMNLLKFGETFANGNAEPSPFIVKGKV